MGYNQTDMHDTSKETTALLSRTHTNLILNLIALLTHINLILNLIAHWSFSESQVF